MKIQFFDTTLRDGEQTPGVNFNTQEKVRLAKQLERWGVDAIEAGFPNASPGDFAAVQAIAAALETTTVVGLARCHQGDIDKAYEALAEAKHPQIHVFIATSDIHLTHKLKKTQEEVLETITKYVSYAREKFEIVQFSPEDATRTERAFLLKAVQTAIAAGATIINIPDTVGYSNPTEYGAIFKYLIENIPNSDEIIFSTHCHDDLGMAVANSLAAIENGARRVEGTVNGIGERAGNTALEEVALSLYVRRDFYGHDCQIVLNETKRTSELVSQLAGIAVPRNKAIVGGNAYAHESGIHQDGVLKNPETYEIITPSLVGVAQNSLPLGKLSGRHAFTTRMEELGYTLTTDEMNEAFNQFKILADKKKQITETDLHALVTEQINEAREERRLQRLQVQYVSDGQQGAVVSLATAAGVVSESAVGAGSIQAIYNTIDRLFDQTPHLEHFRIQAITAGEDAQAEVHVTVADKEDGTLFNGVGIDFDVLQASAKAYIQASNLLYEKNEARA